MDRSQSKYFHTAAKMDEAMIALLNEKDFEYITVKEICQKAGVNRSTFYLHYENTRDLLEETVRYLINQFRSYFPMEEDLRVHNRFPAAEQPYVMAFYINGITAIVAQWVQNDCNESIETICGILKKCILGTMDFSSAIG